MDEPRRAAGDVGGGDLMMMRGAGGDSEFTTNQHIDQMRQEMMMSLDQHKIGESPRDTSQALDAPLFAQEMKFRQGDSNLNQDNHHGMLFEVITNKKREKILQIQGFRERDDHMLLDEEDDNEEDNDDKTLFVNLNRIFKDQMQKRSAGIEGRNRLSNSGQPLDEDAELRQQMATNN